MIQAQRPDRVTLPGNEPSHIHIRRALRWPTVPVTIDRSRPDRPDKKTNRGQKPLIDTRGLNSYLD